MSDRLRNNLIAGLIVFAFWCISFSSLGADTIVTDSTSTVTTNGNQTTTKVKVHRHRLYHQTLVAVIQIYVLYLQVVQYKLKF